MKQEGVETEVAPIGSGTRFPTESTVKGRSVFHGESYKQGYDVIIANSDVLEFLRIVPTRALLK